nr:MAG TPA: hypothetical protein [Caudoviricetes sp.]
MILLVVYRVIKSFFCFCHAKNANKLRHRTFGNKRKRV